MKHGKTQLHGAHRGGSSLPWTLRAMRLLFSRLGAVSPGLLGRLAYGLWFRTRRFPESAAGRRVALDARHETVRVGDIPLAVHSWGSGPVVLFLHGWSGRGSQVAAFVAPLLEAGYQVVAPDAPGHGDTPGRETNIFEVARTVIELYTRIAPVHAAITHSFGGMVLAYAMTQGVQVGRVVCISAPADVDFLLQGFAATLSLHPRVLADLRQRIERRFEGDYHVRLSTVENVRRQTVPALIIHDEQDHNVPWQQGERIAAAWPGARFMKTQGLGHGRILRDSSVVAAVVDFINGQPSTSREAAPA
jgi:pimeloyl-ACP methyl ester carboxylesterase